MRLRPCDNLSGRREGKQAPFLEMVRQSDCDECRDNRAGAQAPPPAPPLERVRIYKSVRSRAAKTDNVAVLELVLAANPPSI